MDLSSTAAPVDIGATLAVVGVHGWRCCVCHTTFPRSHSIEHHMITSHHPLPLHLTAPSAAPAHPHPSSAGAGVVPSAEERDRSWDGGLNTVVIQDPVSGGREAVVRGLRREESMDMTLTASSPPAIPGSFSSTVMREAARLQNTAPGSCGSADISLCIADGSVSNAAHRSVSSAHTSLSSVDRYSLSNADTSLSSVDRYSLSSVDGSLSSTDRSSSSGVQSLTGAASPAVDVTTTMAERGGVASISVKQEPSDDSTVVQHETELRLGAGRDLPCGERSVDEGLQVNFSDQRRGEGVGQTSEPADSAVLHQPGPQGSVRRIPGLVQGAVFEDQSGSDRGGISEDCGGRADPPVLGAAKRQHHVFDGRAFAREVKLSCKAGKRRVCSCGLTFDTKPEFRQHRRVAHCRLNQKIFICQVCQAHFAYKRGLNRHLALKGTVAMRCSQCPQGFHDSASLEAHRAAVHRGETGDGGESAPIKEEESTLDSQFSVQKSTDGYGGGQDVCLEEEGSSSGLFPWECSRCQKHFLNKQEFRVHLIECGILTFPGQGLRCFQCNLCGSSFAWLVQYHRHYVNDHKLESWTSTNTINNNNNNNNATTDTTTAGSTPTTTSVDSWRCEDRPSSPCPSVTSEINQSLAEVDLNQLTATSRRGRAMTGRQAVHIEGTGPNGATLLETNHTQCESGVVTGESSAVTGKHGLVTNESADDSVSRQTSEAGSVSSERVRDPDVIVLSDDADSQTLDSSSDEDEDEWEMVSDPRPSPSYHDSWESADGTKRKSSPGKGGGPSHRGHHAPEFGYPPPPPPHHHHPPPYHHHPPPHHHPHDHHPPPPPHQPPGHFFPPPPHPHFPPHGPHHHPHHPPHHHHGPHPHPDHHHPRFGGFPGGRGGWGQHGRGGWPMWGWGGPPSDSFSDRDSGTESQEGTADQTHATGAETVINSNTGSSSSKDSSRRGASPGETSAANGAVREEHPDHSVQNYGSTGQEDDTSNSNNLPGGAPSAFFGTGGHNNNGKGQRKMMKKAFWSIVASCRQGKTFFFCPECLQAFSQEEELEAHCAASHPPPPPSSLNPSSTPAPRYLCFMCSEFFASPLAYNNHIRHHVQTFARMRGGGGGFRGRCGGGRGGGRGWMMGWGGGMRQFFKMFEKARGAAPFWPFGGGGGGGPGGIGEDFEEGGNGGGDSSPSGGGGGGGDFNPGSGDSNSHHPGGVRGDDSDSDSNSKECPFCQKKFRANSRESFFERHVNSHLGVDFFKYKCGVDNCGKTFLERAKYTAHVATHAAPQIYSCGDCGKTYQNRTSLTRHQRIHTGERPYKCSECGEGFLENRDLVRHRSVHTGQAPFQCGQCGTGFTLKASLLTHRRNKHQGLKGFTCTGCAQRFGCASALSKHRSLCALAQGETTAATAGGGGAQGETSGGGGAKGGDDESGMEVAEVKQEPASMDLNTPD